MAALRHSTGEIGESDLNIAGCNIAGCATLRFREETHLFEG
jgi:hypothetical protein